MPLRNEGFFMIKTEKYKLFHNSKDFEIVLKESIPEFNKSIPITYDVFCKTILKNCLLKESIIIIFKNDKPIGYFIIDISNRKVLFSFSYILPKERGNGYSNILRVAAFDTFKNMFDNITVACDPQNVASYKGLLYLLNKYNCKFKKSNININGKWYDKFEIEKFN